METTEYVFISGTGKLEDDKEFSYPHNVVGMIKEKNYTNIVVVDKNNKRHIFDVNSVNVVKIQK